MRIRIKSAVIKRMRNVSFGEVKIPHVKSNVLGIYGQNGSGKTTFIYVLEILKALLSGRKLDNRHTNMIADGEENSEFSFEFSIQNSAGQEYAAHYSVVLSRSNIHEVLKIALPGERSNEIVNCDLANEANIFTPEVKKRALFGTKQNLDDKLRVAKLLCAKEMRSFIFSREFEACIDETGGESSYLVVIKCLMEYGRRHLFVVSNRASGLISLDVALPVMHERGMFAIPIDKPFVVGKEKLQKIEGVIAAISFVLCEIVPGLKLELHHFGEELMEDSTVGARVQMVRVDSTGKRLPLKYESEGIKKIVSILHLLIAVYNDPFVTLAVDELDSGIFEYLLGELLGIMQNTGRGQLIFTSHNLFPLEKLDSSSILFTTTNPNNRYVRMFNVKSTNNLRSRYLREISLGSSGKEELYQETNSIEIAHAMRKVRTTDEGGQYG